MATASSAGIAFQIYPFPTPGAGYFALNCQIAEAVLFSSFTRLLAEHCSRTFWLLNFDTTHDGVDYVRRG